MNLNLTDDNKWKLDINNIAKCEKYPLAAQLASYLLKHQYISLHDFFCTFLTVEQIKYGESLFANVTCSENEATDIEIEEVMLITFLLMLGEGLNSINGVSIDKCLADDNDDITALSKANFYLTTIFAGLQLEQSGLIKIHWENVSFDESKENTTIFSRIE